MRSMLVFNSTVYIKVLYHPRLKVTLGKTDVFSAYSMENLYNFRTYIILLLAKQIENGNEFSNISHIKITVIPLNLNLLTKYKVDTINRVAIRNFIYVNFSTKTIILVTVNPNLLGGELDKTVHNDKIVDLIYYIATGFGYEKSSLQRKFACDRTLSNLSIGFKFYKVMLNGHYYIIGVNHLTVNTVQKVRLSLRGVLLEKITDTVLLNGNIKRVNDDKVIIMKGYRVINYYKETKFPSIINDN